MGASRTRLLTGSQPRMEGQGRRRSPLNGGDERDGLGSDDDEMEGLEMERGLETEEGDEAHGGEDENKASEVAAAESTDGEVDYGTLLKDARKALEQAEKAYEKATRQLKDLHKGGVDAGVEVALEQQLKGPLAKARRREGSARSS